MIDENMEDPENDARPRTLRRKMRMSPKRTRGQDRTARMSPMNYKKLKPRKVTMTMSRKRTSRAQRGVGLVL